AGGGGLGGGGREDPALTSRRTAATSGRGDVESSKQTSWYQVRPTRTGVSVTIRRIDVSLWAGDEPVDRPLTRGCVVDHVQLAVSVFSEGDDVEGRVQQQAGAPGATARQRAPGASRAEVAEDVGGRGQGKGSTPIGVAAGDRAVPGRVVVPEGGGCRVRAASGRARRVAGRAFQRGPAIVGSARGTGPLEVDLLPLRLADMSE